MPAASPEPPYTPAAYWPSTSIQTPEPSPTSTATQTSPATSVLKRELEYRYTIDLPDNWSQEGEGRYSSASTSARLTISSQFLPTGYTGDQFTQLVQDDLHRDWWPDASMFKITSVAQEDVDGQLTARIRYRVQESPDFCALDVEELVIVSQVLQRNPHGFRVKAWMCEHDVPNHEPTRKTILSSFRITTVPAAYYTQFMSVNGVPIKARGTVDPAALQAGAEIVAVMLSGRQDIAPCMTRRRAELAIVPKDQTLTSLPEYHFLKGTRDFTGRSRDTFEIRGVGGVPSQPVSSAAEEQLLGTLEPQHPYYPFRGLVTVHEFAHGIQNLCFTQQDREQWNKFYEEAVQAALYPGSHMMTDVNEYFAVMTTWYFEVTDELGADSVRDDLKLRFPKVYQALDEIYGGAILPEKYRSRQRRQQ